MSNLEHATIFHQSTDACSTCCALKGYLQIVEQSLKRHLQQSDQGPLMQMAAIADVKKARAHTTEAMESHRGEATAAIDR